MSTALPYVMRRKSARLCMLAPVIPLYFDFLPFRIPWHAAPYPTRRTPARLRMVALMVHPAVDPCPVLALHVAPSSPPVRQLITESAVSTL